MKHQRIKLAKGFTLIEIITVIAILVVLAAMGWVATKMVQTRQMNKQAEIQIAQMVMGMNGYRQDNGDILPYGIGDEWSSHQLYAALYCDENNDGAPDKDPQTGEVREPYCSSIKPVESTKHLTEVSDGIMATMVQMRDPKSKKRAKKRYYALIDPWGKPYLYRLGYELRDEKRRAGKGINPDFDIFSQGVDGLGNGLTNTGDNEDNISNISSWN